MPRHGLDKKPNKMIHLSDGTARLVSYDEGRSKELFDVMSTFAGMGNIYDMINIALDGEEENDDD